MPTRRIALLGTLCLFLHCVLLVASLDSSVQQVQLSPLETTADASGGWWGQAMQATEGLRSTLKRAVKDHQLMYQKIKSSLASLEQDVAQAGENTMAVGGALLRIHEEEHEEDQHRQQDPPAEPLLRTHGKKEEDPHQNPLSSFWAWLAGAQEEGQKREKKEEKGEQWNQVVHQKLEQFSASDEDDFGPMTQTNLNTKGTASVTVDSEGHLKS